MTAYILYYRGKVVIKEDNVYKVPDLFQSFLSMNEAKNQIDKTVKDESFFNLKQLNDKTNKATIKQG